MSSCLFFSLANHSPGPKHLSFVSSKIDCGFDLLGFRSLGNFTASFKDYFVCFSPISHSYSDGESVEFQIINYY